MALPRGTDIEPLGQKASGGVILGSASASLIGFYGIGTAVAQPQCSVAGAVATTAALIASVDSAAAYGFTSAQATAIIVLVNQLRAMGVTLNLWGT